MFIYVCVGFVGCVVCVCCVWYLCVCVSVCCVAVHAWVGVKYVLSGCGRVIKPALLRRVSWSAPATAATLLPLALPLTYC